MTDPTSPEIAHLQELELDDSSFEEIPTTPASTQSSLEKTPNKVRAAAAMWENSAATSLSPPSMGSKSPVGSFRSVAPGSTSPEKRIPGLAVDPIDPAAGPIDEEFAEVALAPERSEGSIGGQKDTKLSNIIIPKEETFSAPGHIITPPAAEPPVSKAGSFFSLSFGTPAPVDPPPAPPSREGSLNTPSTGWRNAMSNLLTRSTSAAAPTDQPLSGGPESAGPSRLPSPSLLLHHINDDVTKRDRRQSRELGGGERIREGFNRVRGEMEGAAREMRRETAAEVAEGGEKSASGSRTGIGSDEEVDWVFWGAVVQDFEEVARDRPRDLSRAIQQGIPGVIRSVYTLVCQTVLIVQRINMATHVIFKIDFPGRIV